MNGIIAAMVGGAVGCALGIFAGMEQCSGKDAVMAQFESWEPKEQKEFLIEATKDKKTLKRSIAEDWCAINKNTQRVCWNARMVNPIRGGK